MNALELANALEVSDKHPELINVNNRAASELRRLYEENQELLQALKDSDALITQLMPGVKHIALQDYGFLNATLINNTKAIAKATGESK